MKKIILFVLFFSIFFLVIPEAPLHADVSFRCRLDAGQDILFPLAFVPESHEESNLFPVIPLMDLGFYGQLNLGIFHLGAGLRGMSFLFFLNLFWPSIYTELNLWRFTLNVQVGGGVLYLFPVFFFSAPVIIPELSLWYAFDRRKRFHAGVGAMALISPKEINEERLRNFGSFRNNVVFYTGFKYSLILGKKKEKT